MKYSRHTCFDKQFTKLQKRFRTLEEDLEIAKMAAIELLHVHRLDNRSVELIPKFDGQNIKIYKVKKFACKSLRGKGVRSGIRVVYAFLPATAEVLFLEIYYKEKGDSDMNYEFIQAVFEELENK